MAVYHVAVRNAYNDREWDLIEADSVTVGDNGHLYFFSRSGAPVAIYQQWEAVKK